MTRSNTHVIKYSYGEKKNIYITYHIDTANITNM